MLAFLPFLPLTLLFPRIIFVTKLAYMNTGRSSPNKSPKSKKGRVGHLSEQLESLPDVSDLDELFAELRTDMRGGRPGAERDSGVGGNAPPAATLSDPTPPPRGQARETAQGHEKQASQDPADSVKHLHAVHRRLLVQSAFLLLVWATWGCGIVALVSTSYTVGGQRVFRTECISTVMLYCCCTLWYVVREALQPSEETAKQLGPEATREVRAAHRLPPLMTAPLTVARSEWARCCGCGRPRFLKPVRQT